MTRPIDRRRGAAAPKPAPRAERQVAFRLGLSAETRAAALLLAKGFRIVARRWRSPVGEIDLVARRGRLLVFVEVKARGVLEDAAEAVTPRQQRRIAPPPGRGLRATPRTSIATSGSTPCWSRRGACRATFRQRSRSWNSLRRVRQP
jgi:putative endonuclease